MDHREIIKSLIEAFSPGRLSDLLRRIAPAFRPRDESLDALLGDDPRFDSARKLGLIELPGAQTILVAAVHVTRELTERTGRKKQYEVGKRILKASGDNAALLAFYDDAGCFRLSLITVTYHGTRRQFSTFRRYTFFVDPNLPNKTFVNQIGRADFSSMEKILEAFSLEAVSDEFYKEFKPKFDAIADAVQGTEDAALRQDFALLFVIRIIFLGFVQKKGWLGDNRRFLQAFWEEYRQSKRPAETFYREWLEPLFFEALKFAPGRKIAYGHAPFSEATQEALQMAPYLNGELFERKQGVDDEGLWIPDERIGEFFDFLFQYNFTVEENELYDEELELNPEFLGIIFERITNMDQGAVYTPRVEVDLMCRLALVQWLAQTPGLDKRDLYHLFFREAGTGEAYDEYQKQGDFSPAEIRTLIGKLESVTVCDPAAGSGAFEVGMLQVLDRTLENLYTRNNTPADLKAKAPTSFERKKAIIARSLYGVEVKRWAVWINHLRLWLTLFVEMQDERRMSQTPLLPNLTFKVRTGDSLVQRLGDKTFPVRKDADLPALPAAVKRRITALKKKKRDFFYNRGSLSSEAIEKEELDLFRAILDEEIEKRRKAIRQLQQPRSKKLTLLDEVARSEAAKEEAERRQREAQIARLQAEIEELGARKRSLKDERPFIWSLEFAEIFFDRGGFDIVIGNPPYVRQESITDPRGQLSPQAYKEALMEMVRLDFPRYFAKSGAQTDRFKKGRKPSGRSDLYTYFYIRSLRLLNEGGMHLFICSNSWLDVGYGAWLQEFFLRNAPLHFVIDNHAKRSFTRADVNTVITVASAPRPVPDDHVVRFVAFKQPFEDAVLSDNLLDIEGASGILKRDAFRVFPITVKALLDEGSDGGKYVGDKWGGKYLRAPDIFFTILEKGRAGASGGSPRLVRLGEVAEVRRGFTTGANDFFYLEPLGPGSQPGLMRVRNGAGWEGEIEEEFLKPVIKSPRECRTIVIDPEDLRYRIFMCHKSKEELEGTRALEYIEWGEEQGYPQRSTLRSRRPWWDLGVRRTPDLVMIKGPWNRHFVMINHTGTYCDQQLYEIYFATNTNLSSEGYKINSTLSALFFELEGRRNFGEGILWLAAYEIKNVRILRSSREEDLPIDQQFLKRPVKSIFTECGIDPHAETPIAEQEPHPLPDRKALDDIVFDALGLTEEERKEVYRAVCQLVWERISKAKSTRRYQ